MASATAYGQSSAVALPDAATWRGLGIHPVDPPIPLSDATLPTTARSQVRLSDARGQWLILSFFATWCGPCRAEFPSMMDLWNATHKEGLDIFALSAEEDTALVARFASELGLKFPVLHDLGGRLSARYRVSSLPTSFIVAPSGEVVGRVVGARDWSQLIPAFRAIMKGEVPDTAALAPKELPPIDDPPTATASLLTKEPISSGESFSLAIDVQWSGTLRDYLLKPPALPELEGMTVLQNKARSSSSAGSSTVRYELLLRADEARSYVLDPIRLNFRDLRNGAESGTEARGLTIIIAEPYAPLEDMRLWALGIGLLLVGGIGALWRHKTRSRSVATSGADTGLRTAFEALHQARIEGDHRRFVELCRTLASDHGLSPETYVTSDLANDVQYGGHRIPEIDLDRIERTLKADLQLAD